MQRQLRSGQLDAGGLNESVFEPVSVTLMTTFLSFQPVMIYLFYGVYARHVE